MFQINRNEYIRSYIFKKLLKYINIYIYIYIDKDKMI